MAETLLRARLASVAPEVTVGSAGLLFDDRRAEPNAVKALRHRHLDLSSHRSRRLAPELVADATLILGMERLHLRAVLELDEALFPRCFTLPEFVRSAAVFGPRPVDEPLRSWKDVNDEAGRLGGLMGQLTPPSRGDDSKGDER